MTVVMGEARETGAEAGSETHPDGMKHEHGHGHHNAKVPEKAYADGHHQEVHEEAAKTNE